MRRPASATLAILLVLSAAGPARADPGPESVVSADLEGSSIEVEAIPSYHCHDRSFPQIRCFATARGLERDLARLEARSGMLAANASDYVQIYAGQDRTGASMVVSQDYDTLFVVGWNDRIRSYRGLNNASGIFWTDWYATGSSLAFCCNVVDPYLPATFDKAITSVYRR